MKWVLISAAVAVLAVAQATPGRADDVFGGMYCDATCRAWMQAGAIADAEPQVASPAAATISKAVAPGRQSKISDLYSLEPNCRSRGAIEVSLSRAPRFGTVFVGQFRGRPSFPPEDDMSACNSRMTSVTRVLYRGNRRHVGNDDFAITATYPSGNSVAFEYAISSR